ncbi:MAG: N-acetylmuramoyl-L-alanine amidase family protein [Opitutales bacterium]
MPSLPQRSRLKFIALGTLGFLRPDALWSRTAKLFGQSYTQLKSVASRFGMGHSVVSSKKTERIASRWSNLSFTIHKREMVYNKVKLALGFAIAETGGNLWLSESDIKSNLEPLLIPQRTNPKPKLYRIVLDPGHGGKDTGAINKSLGIREKDLALDVANRLKRKLGALGYQVLLTRESDKFIELKDRAAFANKVKADLFVSIHFNSVTTSSVNGIETFVMSPKGQPSTRNSKRHRSDAISYAGNVNDTWNLIAGYTIQKKLVETFTDEPDRGVKRARFAVLREVKVPAMLLELGFLSHYGTAKALKSSNRVERLAECLKDGIFEYQKRLNQIRGR